MFIWIVVTLIVGAGFGFGFRGWISRQKIAIGEHVMGAVKSGDSTAVRILGEVQSKL